MTQPYRAYLYPNIAAFDHEVGGWSVSCNASGRKQYFNSDQMPEKVAAMEGAGWTFNDARQDGFPF